MRDRVSKLVSRLVLDSEWTLIALGAFIGVATAFGALGFAFVLHEVEYLVRSTKRHGDLWLLVAFPVGGALLTSIAVHLFAGESRGHGVPPVSYTHLVEQIKIETRRFAKNQRTWLRRLRRTPDSVWIDAETTPREAWAGEVIEAMGR